MSEVLLHIKGSQLQGEDSDSIELTTQGELQYGDNGCTLAYEETEGEGESIRTEICVADRVVTMHKKGAVDAQFIFELGKTFITSYKTPFGDLDVSLLPTLVDAKVERDQGKIELEYVLNIAGAEIVNRLHLSYTS